MQLMHLESDHANRFLWVRIEGKVKQSQGETAKLLTFRLFTVLCSNWSNSSATAKVDIKLTSRMYGSTKGCFIAQSKFLAIK